MLWSYWPYRRRAGVLETPRRFKAYRTRGEACAARSNLVDGWRRHKIVAVLLRGDGDRVVPEFHVAAVGATWSLPARWDVDHFVVAGEVPAPLWYQEKE